MESLQESINLCLNTLVQQLFQNQLAILKLVIVVDIYLLPIILEFNIYFLIKKSIRKHEILTQNGRIILQHVFQTLVDSLVHILQIL